MATPSWEIPWTEEPGGLQSMGSQRVRHDCATNTSHLTFSCGQDSHKAVFLWLHFSCFAGSQDLSDSSKSLGEPPDRVSCVPASCPWGSFPVPPWVPPCPTSPVTANVRSSHSAGFVLLVPWGCRQAAPTATMFVLTVPPPVPSEAAGKVWCSQGSPCRGFSTSPGVGKLGWPVAVPSIPFPAPTNCLPDS